MVEIVSAREGSAVYYFIVRMYLYVIVSLYTCDVRIASLLTTEHSMRKVFY